MVHEGHFFMLFDYSSFIIFAKMVSRDIHSVDIMWDDRVLFLPCTTRIFFVVVAICNGIFLSTSEGLYTKGVICCLWLTRNIYICAYGNAT